MPNLSDLQGGLELKRRLIEGAKKDRDAVRAKAFEKSDTLAKLCEVVITDSSDHVKAVKEITRAFLKGVNKDEFQQVAAALKPPGVEKVTKQDLQACALGLDPGQAFDRRLLTQFEYKAHEEAVASPKPRKDNHRSVQQIIRETTAYLNSGKPLSGPKWQSLQQECNQIAQRLGNEKPEKARGLQPGFIGTFRGLFDAIDKRSEKAQREEDRQAINQLDRLFKTASTAAAQYQVKNAVGAEYQVAMATPAAQPPQPGAQAELHIIPGI
ncbi:hypothetical protein PsalMR5_03373 [Piscirickettsia salmonis]|uniref:hypothetical protein n=1 Tax=Piscirickettsia salmonis TaxID=1238 RepID=UPI0012BAAB47|nr:hypothetical protein [Piscirickettsia salmonis]QGP55899.1 hypothetical protein PsalSR1_03368 [Piscirickettsia salmonis]QGP58226.1 hypothetical protein PsalBI1_00781 [Piscirickettsia salmonis]QGP65468.1 hypothetical protein PsalMR5_03373 [Piscirickettsia salmonis]